MATSLFFMPTDQNSMGGNPNELLMRNTHLVNGEIRTETQKSSSRGRKPGSKKSQQNQKKQKRRGMGVAALERVIEEEEEKKKLVGAAGGGNTNPNATRLPVSDPVVVLQGFPSYGGGPNGGCRSRIYCGGGVGSSGQIMIDPVWGFVETASTTTHELSSIPNHPQIYNNNRCDTCFKKKRLDGGDQNVVRSNGGGIAKYTMIPPPINGYDQRSQGGFFYDHRIARSASFNPYFNDATNHTGSMEEFGNPRNGSGGSVKEYEFFPGKYDDFPGNYGETVATSSLGDYSPNTSTIDLSLKL